MKVTRNQKAKQSARSTRIQTRNEEKMNRCDNETSHNDPASRNSSRNSSRSVSPAPPTRAVKSVGRANLLKNIQATLQSSQDVIDEVTKNSPKQSAEPSGRVTTIAELLRSQNQEPEHSSDDSDDDDFFVPSATQMALGLTQTPAHHGEENTSLLYLGPAESQATGIPESQIVNPPDSTQASKIEELDQTEDTIDDALEVNDSSDYSSNITSESETETPQLLFLEGQGGESSATKEVESTEIPENMFTRLASKDTSENEQNQSESDVDSDETRLVIDTSSPKRKEPEAQTENPKLLELNKENLEESATYENEELTLEDEIKCVLEAAKDLPDLPPDEPINPENSKYMNEPSNGDKTDPPTNVTTTSESDSQGVPDLESVPKENPCLQNLCLEIKLKKKEMVMFWDGEMIERDTIPEVVFTKTKDLLKCKDLFVAMKKILEDRSNTPHEPPVQDEQSVPFQFNASPSKSGASVPSLTPIGGDNSTVRRSLAPSSRVPAPSNAEASTTADNSAPVEIPKRKKIKLADFKLKTPVVLNDSDDSIGPNSSSSRVPAPSNAEASTTANNSTPVENPKQKKIKLAGFKLKTPVVLDDSDSDDSIGPSVSLRGAMIPNKRPEKENRAVQNNSVSSSYRSKVVSKLLDEIGPMRRKKNPWTPEETELVRRGFNRYGTTCRLIRERYFDEDSPRTIANIRDKIKTMQRRGELD